MPFDRLLVCLPAAGSIEPLLVRASRFAAALPPCPVEIVAAPAHALHGAGRSLVRRVLGRWADAVHLVPHPERTVAYAVAHAGASSVVVAAGASWRDERRARAALLSAPSDFAGRSLLTLIDTEQDAPAVVTTALDLAHRLALARVIVCDLQIGDAPMGDEAWLARGAAREERLDIFMARVPDHPVPIVTRTLHSALPDRSVARLAAVEDVALVVTRRRLSLDLPLLRLPGRFARPHRDSGGWIDAWRRLSTNASP